MDDLIETNLNNDILIHHLINPIGYPNENRILDFQKNFTICN